MPHGNKKSFTNNKKKKGNRSTRGNNNGTVTTPTTNLGSTTSFFNNNNISRSVNNDSDKILVEQVDENTANNDLLVGLQDLRLDDTTGRCCGSSNNNDSPLRSADGDTVNTNDDVIQNLLSHSGNIEEYLRQNNNRIQFIENGQIVTISIANGINGIPDGTIYIEEGPAV